METTHHTIAEKRRPLNVSVTASAVEEAKHFGLNVSRIADAAIQAAVRKEKERRYLEENREAIAEYNAFVEKHGVLITPIWMTDDAAL